MHSNLFYLTTLVFGVKSKFNLNIICISLAVFSSLPRIGTTEPAGHGALHTHTRVAFAFYFTIWCSARRPSPVFVYVGAVGRGCWGIYLLFSMRCVQNGEIFQFLSRKAAFGKL